jgi:(E)-4-hydroxy-3-methylbut-2-enyl-diphosphate synthase
MRRKTRQVKVGPLTIGSEAPISVQTMWDRAIERVDDTLIERINRLAPMGCDIIRFGVPTMDDAVRLGEIAARVKMPVVADIHFDYKIALKCLDYPIAKLRINPGNIGRTDFVAEVARKAAAKNVPIRIGVNGGSLEKRFAGLPKAEALVASALEEADVLEKTGFTQIVISIKDSNPHYVLEACRKLAALCDYPLHLGITEAGTLIPSVTKSAFYLGILLSEGIGDTIRISISDTIENEVMAGRQLLSVLGLDAAPMPRLISCPRCARNTFDTQSFAQKIEPVLYTLRKDISVAVMGCVVNGPGEAAGADLAITGAGGRVFVYKKGERIFEGSAEEAEAVFMRELLA